MKVLLRRNVAKLGKFGEVVDVKPGYARNYLLPCHLAVVPTKANVQAVEAERERYLAELAKLKAELQAKADLINGKEITIAARANEEGHLYVSVGPAQICESLSAEGHFVEPEHVALDQPIRQLDKYDVTLAFEEDVTAEIHVWVVPIREGREDEEFGEADEPAAGEPEGAPDREAASEEATAEQAEQERSPAES